MNQVRLYKQLYLPCKLVSLKGNTHTRCFEVFEEISPIIWKVEMPKVPKLRGKVKKIWIEFLNWMKQKQVIAVYDFKKHAIMRYQISECSNYLVEDCEGNRITYQK